MFVYVKFLTSDMFKLKCFRLFYNIFELAGYNLFLQISLVVLTYVLCAYRPDALCL